MSVGQCWTPGDFKRTASLTCKMFSARRMSPRESLINAERPFCVRLHPSLSMTTCNRPSTWSNSSGLKRNLVQRDWIAGMILLT